MDSSLDIADAPDAAAQSRLRDAIRAIAEISARLDGVAAADFDAALDQFVARRKDLGIDALNRLAATDLRPDLRAQIIALIADIELGEIDYLAVAQAMAENPLAAARGLAVIYQDLLSYKLPGGGAAFSDLTMRLLRKAEESPHQRLDDSGRSFVTARALWEEILRHDLESGLKVRSAAAFLAEWLQEDDLIDPPLSQYANPPGPGPQTAASADLVAVLAAAAAIVRQTLPRQRRADIRHVAAAFLTTPEGRQAVTDSLRLPHPPLRGVFLRIRDALLGHILDQAGPAEDKAAWRQVFAGLEAPEIATGLIHRSVALTLPAFAADHVGATNGPAGADAAVSQSFLENDHLGLAAEARALADLVSLRAAPPPLALGIFGNWGSGKSYFMKMLQEAIRNNQRRAASLTLPGPTPEPVFWQNVVHIEFNAWQYLDTNLWASLVNHIFRELDRKSRLDPWDDRRDGLNTLQIESLIQKMGVVREIEATARNTLAGVQAEIAAARTELTRLAAQETALRKALGAAQAATGARMLSDTAKKALTELGAPDLAQGLGSVGELAAETRSLGGRVGLVLNSSLQKAGMRYPLIGAGVFLVTLMALAGLASQGGVPVLAEFARQAGVVLPLLAGAAAWLLPHLRYVNGMLAEAIEAEAEAERNAAEAASRRAAKEAELETLQQRRTDEEAALARAEAERARLENVASGARPAELLAAFIEDRAGAGGYRRHLGLLSEIRNDFQHLSSLMRRQRDPVPDASLPVIERIVLYIDDLDRCRDETVVAVLEAIHLLLAFDLFVVVVAVDARWLDSSVRRFYAEQLRQDGDEDDPNRPTAADYLEKIFQVPYRLPRLAGSAAAQFAPYVDALVGPVTTTAAPAMAPPPPAAAPDQPLPPASPEPAAATLRLQTLPSPAPEEAESVLETLQRVQLSETERDAIRGLGCLPGMSPRTAKRFVNLYRLLRGRHRAGALEAWLAELPGRTPRFRVAMLWLAFECALPKPAMAALIASLRSRPGSDPLPRALGVALPLPQRLVLGGCPLSPGQGAAFAALVAPMADVTVGDLLLESEEAGRYSFRIDA